MRNLLLFSKKQKEDEEKGYQKEKKERMCQTVHTEKKVNDDKGCDKCAKYWAFGYNSGQTKEGEEHKWVKQKNW